MPGTIAHLPELGLIVISRQNAFLKPFYRSMEELDEEPIRGELFSHERLEQHARSLAAAQTVTTTPRKLKALAARVRQNRDELRKSLEVITQAERDQRAITPAAEWLLDNFHVV